MFRRSACGCYFVGKQAVFVVGDFEVSFRLLFESQLLISLSC